MFSVIPVIPDIRCPPCHSRCSAPSPSFLTFDARTVIPDVRCPPCHSQRSVPSPSFQTFNALPVIPDVRNRESMPEGPRLTRPWFHPHPLAKCAPPRHSRRSVPPLSFPTFGAPLCHSRRFQSGIQVVILTPSQSKRDQTRRVASHATGSNLASDQSKLG